MGDHQDYESVTTESQRLLTQFLYRELELTRTLIDLTRIELRHGNSPNAPLAIKHVYQGLETVHRFIDRVPSPEDRARILEKLQQLESDASTLREQHIPVQDK